MHIHNHLTPAPVGAADRPEHGGRAAGRAQHYQRASTAAAPAESSESTPAGAPAEEVAEPRLPGNSVAHRARAHLASLTGLGNHNFGWLVSQIARGTFDAAAYTASPDTDGVAADGDATSDAAPIADQPAATDEPSPPADDPADVGTTPSGPSEDPVASLLDALSETDEGSNIPAADDGAVAAVELLDALLADDPTDPDVA